MTLADPSSTIPTDLGRPQHTFQCSGPGSIAGSLLALLTFRKNPFGLWTVTVCENGIATRDTRKVPNPNVLQNKDVRWGEFVAARSSLTRTIKGFTTSDFNIYVYDLADGTKFEVISGIGMQDADKLAGLIQDEIFKRQLPRLSAAFEAGEAVDFGRITIDKRGLTFDAEQISWTGVECVKVDNGKLLVKSVGGTAWQMEIYEVKNFDIFWTLLRSKIEDGRMT